MRRARCDCPGLSLVFWSRDAKRDLLMRCEPRNLRALSSRERMRPYADLPSLEDTSLLVLCEELECRGPGDNFDGILLQAGQEKNMRFVEEL